MSVASAAAVGPPPGMHVRLSSNESPFGPSPRAIAAATAALRDGHRYPDDQSRRLRAAIAAHEGVADEQVAVGTGSAALLMDAIPDACVGTPGAEVLAFERSFVVYRLAARNVDARYIEVPTGPAATREADGYHRDVEALLAKVTDATRVVVIDNPGNPTGAHLTGEALRALISALPDQVTIIIDEAYHQFAVGRREYATVNELGVAHPGLLTLRTFSKAYALAGFRVGYVTGPASRIAALDARRTRFNLTAPAQAAAEASLADTAHLARTIDGTIAGRTRMAEGLRALDVAFTEGLGNFLTVELGTAAGPVIEAYAQRGIGVRELAPYDLLQQFRVSIGTEEEVEAFLAASSEILGDVASRR